MSGELPPGSQLPSIPTLVDRYSAATATVQRALTALKAEGLARSEVGKGVYVRDRRALVVDASVYLAPEPKGYTYRLLDVVTLVPPPEVARALDLAENEQAVLRHRLMSYDGDPVELSWSYYPAVIARGTALADRKMISGGAGSILADLGLPQLSLVDRVSARMPTTDEVETLALPPYVPVLRQLRAVRTHDDRPVEVSILVKGSHLHELCYQQQVTERES